MQNPQIDNAIMQKLNVSEVRHTICWTSKGELALALRKGESEYFVVLDSVPLENYKSKEILDILK